MVQYLQNENKTLKYILTTPTDFNTSESLPMIVFLHGAGERGEDIEKIKAHGIPKLFSRDQDYGGLRVVTLSPQCPDERTWYDFKWDVIALIDEVAEKYNVDKNKITLCGISMGGFGTWEIGLQVPEKFAAIAPICGGGMGWRAWYLRNTPIRVYHGRLDDLVPLCMSETMVEAVRSHGGNVEFVIYDDLYHDCWTRAFEQTDLIAWLANSQK